MKLSAKVSVILIVMSFVVAIASALPMIINLDDSFPTPGVIISNTLQVLGIIGPGKNHSVNKIR